MTTRTLPVWADVARIDADHDTRPQAALQHRPGQPQRRPLGTQPSARMTSAPGC